MRRIFTNAEKLAYWLNKIAYAESRVDILKDLSPDEYSSQDWDSSLQKSLNRKRDFYKKSAG